MILIVRLKERQRDEIMMVVWRYSYAVKIKIINILLSDVNVLSPFIEFMLIF
mgnify:CR=1 FL=1